MRKWRYAVALSQAKLRLSPPYRIYSDGAQTVAAVAGVRRLGPGSWGVIVLCPDGARLERCGYDPLTTVPRMEMTAALQGLLLVPAGAAPEVTSDSKFLVRSANEWLAGWISKGWRTASGKAVENQDLWRQILSAQAERKVAWTWVRSHAGHPLNEQADRLAKLGAAGKDCAGNLVRPDLVEGSTRQPWS